MLVDVLVFDGLDEMDAWGPAEVLRSAAKRGADLETRLVTRVPQQVVHGSYGLRFQPDAVWEPGVADVLVVAGGGWAARELAGAWGEVQRGDVLPLLRRAREGTRLLAGVCTGTMLLAHAGLVESRRASTHHTAWADLEALGATVVRDRVVDDGDLLTSGGVTSGIDLALWLLRREFSPELAATVADRMEYTPALPAAVDAAPVAARPTAVRLSWLEVGDEDGAPGVVSDDELGRVVAQQRGLHVALGVLPPVPRSFPAGSSRPSVDRNAALWTRSRAEPRASSAARRATRAGRQDRLVRRRQGRRPPPQLVVAADQRRSWRTRRWCSRTSVTNRVSRANPARAVPSACAA